MGRVGYSFCSMSGSCATRPLTPSPCLLAGLALVLALTGGCGAGGGTATALPGSGPGDGDQGAAVLYVASSQSNSVDAYRLDSNGLPDALPFSSTSLINPRRLAAAGDVLYVALDNSLVSLRPAADGSLPAQPSSESDIQPGASYMEMIVAGDFLYVPARRRSLLVAYRLDSLGGLGSVPDSQVSSFGADYRSIAMANGFLYAVAQNTARIDTFLLQPGGGLPSDPEPQVPQTLVGGSDALLIRNGILYATDQLGENVNAYDVDPSTGLLSDLPDSETAPEEWYTHMALSDNGRRMYTTAYSSGRVDVFDVNPDGSLPDLPPRSSTLGDTSAFTSRLALNRGVLYVAQAGLDRVDVYLLDADGDPPSFPSASTDAIEGSFPVDVLLYSLN